MSDRPEYFFFDLGNVIYLFDYHASASKAAIVAGVTEEKLRSAVYDFGLEEMYENGVISSHRFAEEVARTIGRTFDLDAFLYAVSDMFTFNHEIIRLIRFVQELNIPIGLLSNTCEAHWQWIVDQNDLDFHSSFQDIVLSCRVGRMKPYPEIYVAAESRANVAPAKIFFIDDRAANIQAAQRRGWQTMLFTDVESTMKRIASWKD